MDTKGAHKCIKIAGFCDVKKQDKSYQMTFFFIFNVIQELTEFKTNANQIKYFRGKTRKTLP